MDIGHYLRRLWRLRLLVAVVTVLGLLAGLSTGYDLGLSPPSAKRKTSSVGTASTQMLIDSPRSPVADLSLPVQPLSSRASLYAAFLRSEPVRAIMTRKAGLSPSTPLTIESAGSGVTQVGSVKEDSMAPAGSRVVIVSAQENLPLLNFKTQAPTAAEAVRLANAATDSAREYIEDLQSRQAVALPNRIEVRPIGPPLGNQITSGPDFLMVWVTALALVAGAWVLVLLVDLGITRLRDQAQARRAVGVQP